MSTVMLEIAVILLLVFCNGLLAMAELAVIASRRARLQELAEGGTWGARAALRLAEEPTQFLATVQIGITLVAVVAGAYAGVTIGEQLAQYLRRLPALAPYSEFLGVGLVVATTTYLSLVFGELLPKRLALMYREQIAVRMAPPMWLVQRLVAPVAWILTASTALVLMVLRLHRKAEPSVTPGELVHMVREGAREGVLENSERDMIEGVLKLDARALGAVMTPRHRMVWLDVADDPMEMVRTVTETGHSQYPVCEGGPDRVLGIIAASALLAECWHGAPPDPVSHIRPAVFLPEGATTLDALEALRDADVRLVLVVDEYGTVQGLCSINDILKTLVGRSFGETDEPRPTVIRCTDGSHLVDGMVTMDELQEHLAGVADVTGRFPFYTVAGLVMSELGAIPRPGDTFTWRGLRFRVQDMDKHRVGKVLVTPSPTDDESP